MEIVAEPVSPDRRGEVSFMTVGVGDFGDPGVHPAADGGVDGGGQDREAGHDDDRFDHARAPVPALPGSVTDGLPYLVGQVENRDAQLGRSPVLVAHYALSFVLGISPSRSVV